MLDEIDRSFDMQCAKCRELSTKLGKCSTSFRDTLDQKREKQAKAVRIRKQVKDHIQNEHPEWGEWKLPIPSYSIYGQEKKKEEQKEPEKEQLMVFRGPCPENAPKPKRKTSNKPGPKKGSKNRKTLIAAEQKANDAKSSNDLAKLKKGDNLILVNEGEFSGADPTEVPIDKYPVLFAMFKKIEGDTVTAQWYGGNRVWNGRFTLLNKPYSTDPWQFDFDKTKVNCLASIFKLS